MAAMMKTMTDSWTNSTDTTWNIWNRIFWQMHPKGRERMIETIDRYTVRYGADRWLIQDIELEVIMPIIFDALVLLSDPDSHSSCTRIEY